MINTESGISKATQLKIMVTRYNSLLSDLNNVVSDIKDVFEEVNGSELDNPVYQDLSSKFFNREKIDLSVLEL